MHQNRGEYSQITEKSITNTMKIRKNPKEKNHGERFHYVNDDYRSVLCIQVNLTPFPLEAIIYLYNMSNI